MASNTEIAASAVEDFDMKAEIAHLLPDLRAFSRSLAGRPDLADDIVQDSVLKAWKARERFEPGTNLKAWLFTIIRNTYYSDRRRAGRIVQDEDGVLTDNMVSPSGQSDQLELQNMRRALSMLPDEQREALMLIGAGGFSHEEASEIMGVAVGTIKSRVFRARNALQDMMNGNITLPSAETIGGSALGAIDGIMQDVENLAESN